MDVTRAGQLLRRVLDWAAYGSGAPKTGPASCSGAPQDRVGPWLQDAVDRAVYGSMGPGSPAWLLVACPSGSRWTTISTTSGMVAMIQSLTWWPR